MNTTLPQPPGEPGDRRQRKSRAALRQALVALIEEAPFGEITVEEIAERADVARATFYKHYADKSALLEDTVAGLMRERVEAVDGARGRPTVSDLPGYTGANLIEGFEHAASRPTLYLLVLTGEAGAGARRILVTAFQEAARRGLQHYCDHYKVTPRFPLEQTISDFVGAYTADLQRWLEESNRPPAAEAAVAFAQRTFGGTGWAMGFEHGELTYVPERAA